MKTPPLLSILLLFVLSCPILSAQQFTDFTWQHPKYAAHSLNEVKHVAGQTFIAVGDEGMLLVSYDNGQNRSISFILEPITKEIFSNLTTIYI